MITKIANTLSMKSNLADLSERDLHNGLNNYISETNKQYRKAPSVGGAQFTPVGMALGIGAGLAGGLRGRNMFMPAAFGGALGNAYGNIRQHNLRERISDERPKMIRRVQDEVRERMKYQALADESMEG